MQYFLIRCRSPGDSILSLAGIHAPDAGVGPGARGPRLLVHCVRIPVSSFGIFKNFFLDRIITSITKGIRPKIHFEAIEENQLKQYGPGRSISPEKVERPRNYRHFNSENGEDL